MAQTTIGFRVKDFAGESIEGLQVKVHPVEIRAQRRWANVFIDKPITVQTGASTNYYYVGLEAGYTYTVEVTWPEPDRSRIGQSWWSEPFTVPDDSSIVLLPNIIGLPPGNAEITVIEGIPGDTESHQFVVDETTGDLYERR